MHEVVSLSSDIRLASNLCPSMRDRAAIEFLWADQDGWFEVAFSPAHRQVMSRADALAALPQMRYFAPTARKQRGSRKSDVADQGNVLWADIDSRDALTTIEDKLVPLGIRPSLVIDSGNKGFWIYLKLTSLIPVEEVEGLNRRLGELVGADHCFNRDRLARLPGSVHPDSGNQAHVVEFSGKRFKASELDRLLPVTTDAPSSAVNDETDRTNYGGVPHPVPRLSQHLMTYVRARPKKGEGWDRSEVEQKIFLALVGQGWSDEQIIVFSDANSLSKHCGERMRRGNLGWTERSIAKAREFYEMKEAASPSYSSMCRKDVVARPNIDRHELLKQSQCKNTRSIIDNFVNQHPCSEEMIRRVLNSLVISGYLTRIKSGTTFIYLHTPKATKVLTSKFTLPIWTPPVSDLKSRERIAWTPKARPETLCQGRFV